MSCTVVVIARSSIGGPAGGRRCPPAGTLDQASPPPPTRHRAGGDPGAQWNQIFWYCAALGVDQEREEHAGEQQVEQGAQAGPGEEEDQHLEAR